MLVGAARQRRIVHDQHSVAIGIGQPGFGLSGQAGLHPDGPLLAPAVETGLAAAEWYHTEVPRKVMKELMAAHATGRRCATRSSGSRCTSLFAAGGIYFWGIVVVRAVLDRLRRPLRLGLRLAAGTNAATAPPSGRRWMNDVVYHIACFQVMRNPVNWRWSHARHHTDTIIVGRDAEIAWMHPVRLGLKALAYVGHRGRLGVAQGASGATPRGELSTDEKDYIPESEWPKVDLLGARPHDDLRPDRAGGAGHAAGRHGLDVGHPLHAHRPAARSTAAGTW